MMIRATVSFLEVITIWFLFICQLLTRNVRVFWQNFNQRFPINHPHLSQFYQSVRRFVAESFPHFYFCCSSPLVFCQRLHLVLVSNNCY